MSGGGFLATELGFSGRRWTLRVPESDPGFLFGVADDGFCLALGVGELVAGEVRQLSGPGFSAGAAIVSSDTTDTIIAIGFRISHSFGSDAVQTPIATRIRRAALKSAP